MKKLYGKILALVFVLSLFVNLAFSQEQLLITLLYPQTTNAPKKEVKKKEKPVPVSGKVSIDVTGINPAQLNNTGVFAEYYLDSALVYSSENNKPFGFVLDSALYPNGQHSLTVNLWDKEGTSAIGIREIIIKNNEN